jgi:hypoxia up-regulated 1
LVTFSNGRGLQLVISFFWLTNNNIVLLQAKLQEFLGRRGLDKHLDADEAIVLGASLHAANLSDGIKLNRKLGMIDGSTYALVLEIDGPGYFKDESIDQILVPRMKKMPIKVSKVVFLLSCG